MTIMEHAQQANETGPAEITKKRFNLWDFLTAPHPRITDIEQKRQSRLLSGIIFVLLFTSLLGTSLIVLRSGIPSWIGPLLIGLSIAAGLYAVNRLGYYRAAAWSFVILNFVLIYLQGAVAGGVEWLFFTSMAMLIAALFLPARVVFLFYLGSIVAQLAAANLNLNTVEMSNVGAFVIFLVTSTMVIVFVNHRNALERERQAELQLANQRLRESEIFLEKRVEERTFELQIAKEVAEFARERAEEADRTKSQFLASMSHELRTPLNSILTFNELLMMEAMGPVNEEQKDFLGKTLESGRHLLSLINDVLDITKLSAGMMQMNTETAVDLRSDIASVYSTAESLLKHKPDVKLVMDIDDPLPTVTADRRRIRQIMLNLVSNAGKFTEEGTITISAKRRGADFLFAVIDTGPGIPEAHHEAIFEPFVQTETGVKHAAGTGLGLAIARRLTEAHQGKLWLESEAGQGAAFYFTIPAEPVRVEKSA